MYFLYTLALTVGLLLIFPYYLVRFRKYLPTVPDRFGFVKLPQMQDSIWVHAVSVGEVKAVERLLEGLRQQFPDKPLVVSTVTPAGQELARERIDIVHGTFYFPIDLPWCVRHVLDRLRPEIVIIAETEIWPNFLRECRIRGIRVMMINGRISDKSFTRYRLVRRWLGRVFKDYTIMGMQSETDRQRIEAIGADPQKVTVFGNLKYDAVAVGKPLDARLEKFLSTWQPVWIAASTMPGEEEFVLDAFAQLCETHPRLTLIIAPRSYSGPIWRTFGIWRASSSKRTQPSRFKMRRNLPRQSNNFWSIRNERPHLPITRTPSFLKTEEQPTAYFSFFNRSGRAGEPRFSIPGSGSREALYLGNSADAAPQSSGNQRWKSDSGGEWQNADRHRACTSISGKGIPPGDFVTRLRPD